MPVITEKKFTDYQDDNYLDLTINHDDDESIVFLNIWNEVNFQSMSVGLLKTDIEELILDLIKLKNEMQ